MNKLFLIGVIVVGIVIGTAAGVYLVLIHDLPQIRELESFRPSSVTRVYSSDGVLLAELFAEKRDIVPLAAVPESLVTALITTEDRTFFNHSGIDLKGILRALMKDVKYRRFVEGASTITQQLAKTLFLTNKKTLNRKLKEALLAFQLERRYTKNEILQLYLNQVYFGSGAYGIKSAAEIFFGKPVGELTLAECALIAGMPKSPSRYSPLVDPDLAVQRRNVVLRQMLQTKTITHTDYQAAIHEPLAVAEKQGRRRLAPYFIDAIVQQLESIVGPQRLYKGGLTIHTTLDSELQQTAEQAAIKRLDELKKRMERNGVENPVPQCAILSLDIASGGILCMVGGRDYRESAYNRATTARRQPGSAFKPVVFACAIEAGFTEGSLLQDTPIAFKIPGRPEPWRPENFSKRYSGDITLRRALTHSKNVPTVRLFEQLGSDAVIDVARRLGIQSPLSPYLSLALGTSEVTLLELTAAYAAFANQGKYVAPMGVLSVQDSRDRILWQAEQHEHVAIKRETAAITTDILQGVILEGTGRRARVLAGPLAGKTGTTNAYNDALFIGFSPTVVTGVWVGQDAHGSLGSGETGARAALPVWIDVMQRALKNRPVTYFDVPDGTVEISFDPVSGRQIPRSTPEAVVGLFIDGTEPPPRSKYRYP